MGGSTIDQSDNQLVARLGFVIESCRRRFDDTDVAIRNGELGGRIVAASDGVCDRFVVGVTTGECLHRRGCQTKIHYQQVSTSISCAVKLWCVGLWLLPTGVNHTPRTQLGAKPRTTCCARLRTGCRLLGDVRHVDTGGAGRGVVIDIGHRNRQRPGCLYNEQHSFCSLRTIYFLIH